jgi:predicted kinase
MKRLKINRKSKSVNSGIFDPAIFKAFVVKKTTLGHGLKMINSDDLFEKMMKDAGLSLNLLDLSVEETKRKDEIRDRAKELTESKLLGYINGRLGVVIDGTGRDIDKIKSQKKRLEDLGYDTYMIFVNTSIDTALKRNKMRERSVPEDLVKEAWNKVQNNMGIFQNLFGNSNFKIVDNNVANEDLFRLTWKDVLRFSKDKIKNNIARNWIKSEMEKRRQSK